MEFSLDRQLTCWHELLVWVLLLRWVQSLMLLEIWNHIIPAPACMRQVSDPDRYVWELVREVSPLFPKLAHPS